MTGRAREHRCPMRLLLVVLFLCGPAWASDEVDYSAPYLTLEDGKLVTKYPAKPHKNSAPAAAAASADAAGAGPDGSVPSASPTAADPTGTGHPKALLAAAVAVAVVAAAAALLARRRNRTRRV